MGSPIVPAILSPNASLLGIPSASHRAPAPRVAPPSAGANREEAPRWGRHSPFHPRPSPQRGSCARAASQVAPLLFYLSGCLFFADWKEKRRREKGARGSAFAARGGVSGRPPERSRSRAHRRPSHRPTPGLRLPSLPPSPRRARGRRIPTSPPALSLRASVRRSVCPGARL